MKANCEFSLSHYRAILRTAKRGFSITSFAGYKRALKGKKPLIILRHDLDSGLQAALKMAYLENRLGIQATYFVQLHSDCYSTVSSAGTGDLLRISGLGHEIGLHYDPDYYNRAGWQFKQGIQRDLETLSNILGRQIRSVARHLPLLQRQRESFPASIRYNAFDPRFINGDFKYISDSNGVFRQGCFCNHIPHRRHYCFLIHPVWWVNKGKNWQAKLRDQVRVDCRGVSLRSEDKIRTYKAILSKRKKYDLQFQHNKKAGKSS